MTLADLIDLEAQLARDRDADPEALEARDRSLLAGERSSAGRRGPLLHRWLAHLREREPAKLYPGRSVAAALLLIRAVLLVSGFSLGWAAVSAVLSYRGDHPVNVWDFLLGFVGIQVLLVVLLLASSLLPVAALGAPLLGAFRGLFAAIYPRLASAFAAGERTEEWRALWHRLRSRRSLYHRIEPWVLLGLTQTFGVAFNVGALLGLARLVVFSDIAFAWSTTLVDLDAARFHALVSALARPFGWAVPDATPSLALVEATRYSRLEGAYLLSGAGRTGRPELLGGWWPFLAASLAFYGLLPRLLTLGFSRLRLAHLLSRLPLDDVEVSRLVHRLAEPQVETASPTPEAPGPGEPPGRTPAREGPPAVTGRCAVVLWRDLPAGPEIEAAVRRHMGCEVSRIHVAGGLEYEEGGPAFTDGLGDADHVVVVAEAWESPDRSVLRLLERLRGEAGSRRHVRVLLVDTAEGQMRLPADEQVRVWRDTLARLADPYLALEPLGALP